MTRKTLSILATAALVLTAAATVPPKTYTVRAKLGEDTLTRFNTPRKGTWYEDLTAPKAYNITVEDRGLLTVWTVTEDTYNALSIGDEITEARRAR